MFCSIIWREPSRTLTLDATLLPLLSSHSGQEYKPQIALCLTHPERFSESHKATVGWDRSPKNFYLTSPTYLSKIITNFSYWQQVFLAGFVPPVAQRSTLNANQMACKKRALIQDALLFIQLLEKQDGCPSGRGARKEMSSTPSYGACRAPKDDCRCPLVMSLQPIAETGKLILDNST